MGDNKRAKLVSKRTKSVGTGKKRKGLEALSDRLDEGGLLTRALSGQVEILRSAVAALREEVAALALGQRRTELRAELGKAPRPAPERQKRRPSPPSGDGQQSRDQRGRIALKPWEKAGIGRHTWYRRRRLEREAAAQALVAASDERAKPLLMQEESDGESDP